jgi:DNA polymerase III subunit beta
MEFYIQRNILLAGIRKTLGIVEKKTTMPVLNNVLIRAQGNCLTITATDIEMILVADYEAEVMVPGEITVSAKKLYEMIRETPEGRVHVVKNDKNVLTISCQKSLYKINGLSAEEFPSVADDGEETFCVMERKVMADLIGKSIFATSTDDARVNLTGAFMESINEEGKSTLRMVATDGHRMAITDMEIDGGNGLVLEKGVIIPRKGLVEIRKLVEENVGQVSLGVQKGRCVVKVSEVVLKVNLIDAEFPDYHKVIPQEKGVLVEFDKDMVLRALKHVNVISSEGYGGVVIQLKSGRMMLASNDPDVGEASDEIEIIYGGDDMVVGYNVRYLIDAIEVIEEKEVVFEVGSGTRPSVVKGKGNDHYTCMVMPLKL